MTNGQVLGLAFLAGMLAAALLIGRPKLSPTERHDRRMRRARQLREIYRFLFGWGYGRDF